LIDGKLVGAASGERFEVLDPSKNTVLIRVPKGGKVNINRALEAERNAFKNGPWRKLIVSERGKLIWKLADLIQAQAEDFAKPETLDK
jgi:acyl-CoA reductase-like NAD-dependent aldehyde dehydrogenase